LDTSIKTKCNKILGHWKEFIGKRSHNHPVNHENNVEGYANVVL